MQTNDDLYNTFSQTVNSSGFNNYSEETKAAETENGKDKIADEEQSQNSEDLNVDDRNKLTANTRKDNGVF